jgi:hypothetical protein
VALVERIAREHGKDAEVRAYFCEGAFERLQQGDPEGHDAILSAALSRAAPELDVAVLAQASMARAEARLASEQTIPVYGSLLLAVLRVRELVQKG